jgi:hypothetical protein
MLYGCQKVFIYFEILLSPCGIHPEGFFLKERIKVRGIEYLKASPSSNLSRRGRGIIIWAPSIIQ